MEKALVVLIFLLNALNVQSQDFCEFKGIRELNLSIDTSFVVDGSICDIPLKLMNESISNSRWYLLKFNKNSSMVFDIESKNSKSDFDFIIYKVDLKNKTNVCQQVLDKNVIRANFSNKSIKTGLSNSVSDSITKRGDNLNFSKSLKVDDKFCYILMITDYNKQGEKPTIKFSITPYTFKSPDKQNKNIVEISSHKKIELIGNLKNEKYSIKNPTIFINTFEYPLPSKYGFVKYDTAARAFNIEPVNLYPKEPNILVFSSQGYYPYDEAFLLQNKKQIEFPSICLVKIEPGKKDFIESLFFSKKNTIDEYTLPPLLALVKLMKDNPNIIFELKLGNNVNSSLTQIILEKRVGIIKNYLISKGVKSEQFISTIEMKEKYPISDKLVKYSDSFLEISFKTKK